MRTLVLGAIGAGLIAVGLLAQDKDVAVKATVKADQVAVVRNLTATALGTKPEEVTEAQMATLAGQWCEDQIAMRVRGATFIEDREALAVFSALSETDRAAARAYITSLKKAAVKVQGGVK